MKNNYIFLLVFFTSVFGFSQTNNNWTNGGGDGLWSTTSNWSLGTIPNSGNIVRTQNSTTSTVDQAFTIYSIQNIFGTTGDRTVASSGGSVLTLDPNVADGVVIQNVSSSGVKLSFTGNVEINNSAGFSDITTANNASNSIDFEDGSTLSLTTSLEVEDGTSTDINFNGVITGSGNLRIAANATANFGTTASNAAWTGELVFLSNSTVVVNTNDNNTFFSGSKIQVNGTGSLTITGANVFSTGITIGGSNTFGFTLNSNQNNMGSIIFSGAGTLNMDVDPAVTELVFADNSSNSWSTGTLNITGFKDGVIRFGTDSNGLTSAQLSQITVDDGGNGVALDSEGYLYSYDTSWTGTSGTDWSTAGNWSDGVPTAGQDVHIAEVTNAPVIGSSVGVELGDLIISESDGVTISSGATLRVSGSSSGSITYNRSLSTTNWYLVGVPVAGETIEDMIANNSFASGTVPNIGWAPYDNTQTTASDRWDYQTAASTGALTSGGGYSVKLASTGTLTYTGTMQTADVGVSISDGSGGGGNAFNLVGNPYPSFLAANTNADGTNNLLSINTASLTENTLWFWNQATGSYDQINQASTAFYVAPGQGFFVSSTGSNTFNFTEAMQSHQGTDSFQRNATNRPEIQLILTDGTFTRDADIYFIEGTTTGFDNGYDSSIFGGVESSFAIYTQAVADGEGRNLGIQSLPNNDLEHQVIPVGIKATSGTQITISAGIFNLPTGINVYLEDKNDGSFTQLDSTSDFTTTLNADLNGTGRFFLHTSSQALSTEDVSANNIRLFTFNGNNLRIIGVQNETAQLRMYNILGKQVLTTSFEGTGSDDLTLPNVRTGVYIIQLETATGKLNKKVIIE